MPKIGITSSNGKPGAPYLRAIERAGGEAVILPNAAHELEAWLTVIDGVVIAGGVDVDPRRYGGRLEHAGSEASEYSFERDEFEIALVRATRARDIPTLCICRGLQVANVAFGGTLIEDLREELGDRYTIEHRQTDADGVERYHYAEGHTVTVTESSAFARLVGSTSFSTNSMHHQALRTIGEGFVAVGRTSDGIVEVADATFPHPFFYAVQWHPEEFADPISTALFDGLVGAASRDPVPSVESEVR